MDDETRGKLESFLQERETSEELQEITSEEKRSLTVDFNRLLEYDGALADYLLNDPIDFLMTADRILEDVTGFPGVRLRVRNVDEAVDIRDIRSNRVGKFIQTEGILTRVSDVKPEVTEATFKCLRCGEENKILQTEGSFHKPLICENPDCGEKGPFQLLVEKSNFQNWQSLRIQERPEKLRGEKIPRSLDGMVRGDLVDRATPGNRVTITGVLRAFQERQGDRRKLTFRKILEVNHIRVNDRDFGEVELSPEDREWIKGLRKNRSIKEMVINSIAPSVINHEEVKEVVALQLFGSPSIELPDGLKIRGNIHLLLINGGTDESRILKWVAKFTPRGIYTRGKKTTGDGLTVSVVRDAVAGGWTLEMGAMGLADGGGIVCIDEFDEISEKELGAIREAMEHQTTSVAEKGILATLNTGASILAAARPDQETSDAQNPDIRQIGVPESVLSKFDLTLAVQGPRDDRDLTNRLLDLQTRPREAAKPQLSREELRKLIAYARKLHPVFRDDKVKEKIADFVENDKPSESREVFHDKQRQIETIVRLAKAHARLRLSNEIKQEDVQRATDLLLTSTRT